MKLETSGSFRGIVLGIALFSVGCSDDIPMSPETGFISVLVVDLSSNQPLAGVEISIAGANQVVATGANGRAIFEARAGDYFVDARVCCVGPGFIEHHVPVTVAVSETVDVTLNACTTCV